MSRWFIKVRHNEHAKLRIFCFPYAGGSASIFNDWAGYFPADVDVFAVQAPGRETRFKEAPINDIQEIVEQLSEIIMPFVNIPYIFVGHSNGALTAFELGRRLQRLGNFNLEHIYLSAKRAPHLPLIKEPIFDLPYDEFIEELRAYSTIPDDILNDQKMMEVFIPTLRADFALADRHDFITGQLLKSNATLFWGKNDQYVTEEDVLEWQKHILGDVHSFGFEGDHFFIHQEKKKFINEILKMILNFFNETSYESKRGFL